ncbi:MAG: pirin family protein [Longimonas sp.]|uniref:pirin family protein n=1 Tax=Longimonas sp. TaxID=2039626 RepID=UPI00334ADD41
MSTTTASDTPAPDTPTIRLRRSDERGFEDFGWTDNWMTFSFANYHDPEWVHFGPLRVMVENHIQPHEGFGAHPHRDAEILTYVSSGTLTHGDNQGHTAEVSAGEMQLISAGSQGMVHSEENLHDTVEHNYQMWFVPDRPGTDFYYGQKKYTPAERQGQFRCYVSPDGREGTMPINTDAFVYAGLFAPGDTATHPLDAGRGAWLQVVEGQLTIETGPDTLTLHSGDGVGLTHTDALTLTATADSEVLLFDVRMDVPRLWT